MRRVFAVFLLLLAILALFHGLILEAYGNLLVREDGPAQADAILVLAGDFSGSRLRHAASLLRNGYAPHVLVSGPMPIYGVNEADLAIAMIERDGLPREAFEPVYIKASSTLEEAKQMSVLFKQRGLKRILIVTSDYHTARARRLFRRVLGNGFDVRMVAAADEHFPRRSWWREREGLKTVFYESLKTLTSAVEQ